MVDFPGELVQGLSSEMKEAIDYWREYQGEQIRIEYVQLESHGDPHQTTKITHGVEGTIAKVMTLPPGFLLTEALDFVNPELQSIETVPKGGSYTDEKGKMFISFDSIERMVFLDH